MKLNQQWGPVFTEPICIREIATEKLLAPHNLQQVSASATNYSVWKFLQSQMVSLKQERS